MSPFVNVDKSQAIGFYFQKYADSNGSLHTLKFTGFDESKIYQVNESEIYGGDELMNVGIYPFLVSDYQSLKFLIKEVK
ncbi:hypothetical protein Hs30E_16470 [Lactococcus hodotermopsidis]|uniref:Glycosyl hydrolase family 36 C-terminal domain-containing protein n=1 Tax=Pseudolactococcus hodotermopsidis TaxID=2709157 RepID=A0A6A0BE70_9LACT|nr:GH36 C-terminal domain-containing protein [Lactococcus hodotermopsidis]GFH43096.1 hypothetical protein Hs30E_16470 [Lactococcus hodotermopsidis]